MHLITDIKVCAGCGGYRNIVDDPVTVEPLTYVCQGCLKEIQNQQVLNELGY